MERRGFLKLFGSMAALATTDLGGLADVLANADQRTRWMILQREFCHAHMDLVNAQTPHSTMQEILGLPYTQETVAEELATVGQHPSFAQEEIKRSMRELRAMYKRYVKPADAEAFLQSAAREANAVLHSNGMPLKKSAIADEMHILRMPDADYARWEEQAFSKVTHVQKRMAKKGEELEKKRAEVERGEQPKMVAYRQITHKHGDGRYSIDVERRYHRGKWEPQSIWLNRAKAHAKSLDRCFGEEIHVREMGNTRARYVLDVEPGSKAEQYLQERMRAKVSQTMAK